MAKSTDENIKIKSIQTNGQHQRYYKNTKLPMQPSSITTTGIYYLKPITKNYLNFLMPNICAKFLYP